MATLRKSIVNILLERKEAIAGTNCGNCKFFTGAKVAVKDLKLNDQGGVAAPDSEHLALAKKGDLVTLPMAGSPDEARVCGHKEIDQVVTDHMCCAYWDNPGAMREWKE